MKHNIITNDIYHFYNIVFHYLSVKPVFYCHRLWEQPTDFSINNKLELEQLHVHVQVDRLIQVG